MTDLAELQKQSVEAAEDVSRAQTALADNEAQIASAEVSLPRLEARVADCEAALADAEAEYNDTLERRAKATDRSESLRSALDEATLECEAIIVSVQEAAVREEHDAQQRLVDEANAKEEAAKARAAEVDSLVERVAELERALADKD